mmetsp:Transcript_19798/g.37787  ORF Transcript_19798/g.37787 Transcript_19798/m.37787 type:complete len:226 (+) Transcript_19798:312-989(+)
MNVTGNILAARSCVVSHGRCRVITTTRETARSPPSTATKERRAHPTTIAPSLKSHPPPPRGLAIATSAAAAGACVLCHSVRLTAACSATSAVQRQFHSSSGLPGAAMGVGPSASSSGGAAAAAVGSTASIHSHRRPDGRGVALAPASEGTASKSRSLAGASKRRSFALPSPPLPSGWLFFQCRDGTPRPFRGGLRAFHHRCRRRHCGESWRRERWCWLRWAVGCF